MAKRGAGMKAGDPSMVFGRTRVERGYQFIVQVVPERVEDCIGGNDSLHKTMEQDGCLTKL